MQQQNSPQTPEERRFLINQARQLQQSTQTCKLITNSEHSIITGNVREVDEGGVVFEALGTGEKLVSPWSNVAEFVILTNANQQAFSQSAGSGSYSGGGGGYNQRQS